jgi:hypothetical protein
MPFIRKSLTWVFNGDLGWSGVTNLEACQAMAITLANDVVEVVALE